MYDLTVAEVHSFFVGEGGWWVHNATCNIDPKQLQHAYSSGHAELFGITGNWNRTNAQKFESAILNHVAANAGEAGSWFKQPGIWYRDGNNVAVFVDDAGNFVTAIQPNPSQMLRYPHLGGHEEPFLN
jgi:hypothetical protein